MATKRPAPQVHPSRQEQVPEEPRRKRQKPDNLGNKSFKKAHTVNDIKSQIRSLKRLLEHNEELPANIRVEKERALQSAQHELAETQKSKQRSDMIARYHKIRFFDRQKATKRLKRAKKEVAECVQGSKERRAELQRKVEDAEVDVNYAQYYPLDVRYVALFPSKRKEDEAEGEGAEDGAKGSAVAEVERKGDSGMWLKVKACMADGTLDAMRNGHLTRAPPKDERNSVQPDVSTRKRAKEQEGKSAKSKGLKDAESDDESEGGFFE